MLPRHVEPTPVRPRLRGSPPKLLRQASVAVLLVLPLLAGGCTTVRGWFRGAGTYAVAAESPVELGGRGEVVGSILLTENLSGVMMETGQELPPYSGVLTTVTVDPLALELATDVDGRFHLPQLEPGTYSIAFHEPSGREIWARFDVGPNQHLDLVVWVQGALGPRESWVTGTRPESMYPGSAERHVVQSGGRRGGSGGGGSGGGGAG